MHRGSDAQIQIEVHSYISNICSINAIGSQTNTYRHRSKHIYKLIYVYGYSKRHRHKSKQTTNIHMNTNKENKIDRYT